MSSSSLSLKGMQQVTGLSKVTIEVLIAMRKQFLVAHLRPGGRYGTAVSIQPSNLCLYAGTAKT
jgi:hypothetical protein